MTIHLVSVSLDILLTEELELCILEDTELEPSDFETSSSSMSCLISGTLRLPVFRLFATLDQ